MLRTMELPMIRIDVVESRAAGRGPSVSDSLE